MPGRVRTRRQFALFTTPTGRGQSGPLRINFVAKANEASPVNVAYAISRKVGNAVARNQLRRRLRALMDQLNPQPRPGLYLIRCGVETGQLSYAQLEHHLHQALDRAGARA
ncbi:MAG: ribonuclease P protein component [Acidimicrobiales bacterium]